MKPRQIYSTVNDSPLEGARLEPGAETSYGAAGAGINQKPRKKKNLGSEPALL